MNQDKLLNLNLQYFAEEKNYKSSIGVEEFYYAILDESGTSIIKGDVERVKFLQSVTVDMPQELVRAYGDNETAEIASSSGNVSLTSSFHKIPLEDKVNLLGWEKVEGLVGAGSSDAPPYVAVIFAQTFKDGSKQYLGLPKGVFTRPSVSGNTKGESTEFSSEEITAQFMDREVEGFEKKRFYLVAKDIDGETTERDNLFQKIFGVSYPSITTTTTSSTTTTTTSA